jgi:hypothetical protein
VPVRGRGRTWRDTEGEGTHGNEDLVGALRGNEIAKEGRDGAEKAGGVEGCEEASEAEGNSEQGETDGGVVRGGGVEGPSVVPVSGVSSAISVRGGRSHLATRERAMRLPEKRGSTRLESTAEHDVPDQFKYQHKGEDLEAATRPTLSSCGYSAASPLGRGG